MLPEPGAGAVGGAFVTRGVGDLMGVSVALRSVAVGVNCARSVSCAATVSATWVPIIEFGGGRRRAARDQGRNRYQRSQRCKRVFFRHSCVLSSTHVLYL